MKSHHATRLKLAVLAIALIFPVFAFALPGSLTLSAFSWTAPATFADGGPASASDIASYNFYWYSQAGTISDTQKINTTNTTIAPSALPAISDGSYYAVVDAVDSTGVEGLASVTFSFSVKGGVVQKIKKILSAPAGLSEQ